MDNNQQQPTSTPAAQPQAPRVDVTALLERGGAALQSGSDFIKKHGPRIEDAHNIIKFGARFLYKTVAGTYNAVKTGIEEAKVDLKKAKPTAHSDDEM